MIKHPWRRGKGSSNKAGGSHCERLHQWPRFATVHEPIPVFIPPIEHEDVPLGQWAATPATPIRPFKFEEARCRSK